MRKRLTPKFVATATALSGSERSIFWDIEPRGFGLMITRAGHQSFVVQYRVNGRSRRYTIKAGLSLDKARREARKIVGEVAQNRDPVEDRREAKIAAKAKRDTEHVAKTNTLRAVAETYLKRAGDGLRSMEQRRATIERLILPSKLADQQVGHIKRGDIVRLLDQIEEERGAAMADGVLALLGRIFSWHAARTDTFHSPIVRGMTRTKPRERARARILNDDELRAVWKAATKEEGAFPSMIRFLLLTAARRNEAAKMEFAELEGNGESHAGDWVLPASRNKTKQDLVRPLSKAAQAILAELPRIADCQFLFTNDGRRPIGGFSKFKRTFDQQCGVSDWTLHDLRRTARSLMSRAGVPTDHAERVLGHVIGGVRGIYDRYEFYNEKKAALEALAGQIDRIIHPQDNVLAMARK
jgi:integrase